MVILRIADADHVVRRQREHRQRRVESGPLRDATGQEHERALVEDERALDADVADRGERGVRIALGGRDDRRAEVERHPTAPQLLHQRGLRRVAKRPRLAGLGEVKERAVLGDDGVEHPVDVGAHAA